MTVIAASNGSSDQHDFLLQHGSLEIPFKVSFVDRNHLTIHVHPDMRLEVLAPIGKELDSVLERVDLRGGWISKQWHYFERYQPTNPSRKYLSGETHRYLGRQYQLKVITARESDVKLKGRFLQVHHPDGKDYPEIERLVTQWYRDHASRLFNVRLASCLEICKSLGLAATPRVSIRQMKRRWGSCTKTGNITLNLDLIRTPIHCIDYVIIHELCHLKVHSHSPAFYRILNRIMPDWEKRKSRLDSQEWS